jgi:hypothetical protein
MESAGCGGEHHSERRHSILDQADVDGVVVASTNELLRSVQRIDEEVGVAKVRDTASRNLFLGNDGHARRRLGKRGEDDELGSAIGFCHRRAVVLRFHLESSANDLEDRFAGFARGDGQFIDQPRAVDAQRGAIRIPPSSRTAAAFM